jgi:4-hydroxy-tetrahydrodipicolinate synthase
MLNHVLTAIITPFTQYDKIDMNSLIELIRFQILNDCGVVLFGTTGECPTITHEEIEEILKNVIKYFDVNNFVIGVGGNNTQHCIDNINIAKSYGFNTFMLTTPYYNKPTQTGLTAHFTHICKYYPQDKFILYNVPGRCGVNMHPNTVSEIYKNNSNIIAIKEASGDLSQMIMIRRLCPQLKLYCGDDGLIVPAMSIGSYGLISVVSNYCPKIVNLIVARCSKNNFLGAFELYSEIDDIVKLLFSETSPSPIKYLLQSVGLITTDNVRLPLVKMQSDENKIKLKNAVDKLQIYSLVKIL